jgi:HSP20 family protein
MSFVRYSPILSPKQWLGLDSFFDDALDVFDLMDPMSRRPSFVGPRTNVENLNDKHIITMATPGLSREDLTIDIAEGSLTISFDHENSENSNYKFQNSFQKSWSLGDNLNLEEITADYNNGVLIIEIPKYNKSEAVARRIEIN